MMDDVCGLRSNEANVSMRVSSSHEFTLPVKCKVLFLSNWLRTLFAKGKTAGRVDELWAHECPLAAFLLNWNGSQSAFTAQSLVAPPSNEP